MDAWRCDASAYAAVRAALRRRLGASFVDQVFECERTSFLGGGAARLPILRPEQDGALSAWRAAGRRGTVVMPTGTGKTVVALACVAHARCPTLVVAPVRTLVYQWKAALEATFGVPAGVVADGQHDPRALTVTTYHSAAIHMHALGNRFGFLVFDEVHHLPSPFFREAASQCAAPFRLGLTATLEREDGRHEELDELVGPVVYRQRFREARGRTLAPYEVVRIPVRLSAEERQRYAAAATLVRRHVARRRARRPGFAWHEVVAAAAHDDDARRALAASRERRRVEEHAVEKLRVLGELLRLHARERILVFTGSNRLALAVSERFLLPAILAHTRAWERGEVLRGLRDGEFSGVVANQVLDEGLDVPAAKIGVVLGGLASSRQSRQRLGRILRPAGEARAVLYEIVCAGTREEDRSRRRRRNDAYAETRHRRV